MTGPTTPEFDFDALYRGESPAEGVPAITTPRPGTTREPIFTRTLMTRCWTIGWPGRLVWRTPRLPES